jgi:hypothetical protein
MEAIDMTEVFQDAPVGEWLALSPAMDRILASAPNLDDALNAAKELGESNPVMTKAPSMSLLIL